MVELWWRGVWKSQLRFYWDEARAWQTEGRCGSWRAMPLEMTTHDEREAQLKLT